MEHLKAFLPTNPIIITGGNKAIPAISAAPWGSALILAISYAYLKMLGADGLTKSTQIAILNANYIKSRLEKQYSILYKGKCGNVAHEMIVDFREFKKNEIDVVDVAKRLMDYGYHAPTVSFPVAGTLMIEPTESESLVEIDRFCDAMLEIKKEIDEVVNREVMPEESVLKNAPHTIFCLTEAWQCKYSKEKAVFPLPYVKENKFWPVVRRVDDVFGDRNLHCSCAPRELSINR
jgi:glycine dehydrogenase